MSHRRKKVLSFWMSILFLAQSLVFPSGLLGCVMESASKICTCNHGSKREVHANPEDSQFQNTAPPKRTHKYKSHGKKEGQKHSHSGGSSTHLANCHTAEPGEIHKCSCSKKKESALELRTFHQEWISVAHSSFPPFEIRVLSSWNIFSQGGILPGYSLSLLRPPKL